MSKPKAARTTPKIAGSPVYGQGSLRAAPGNWVYKHRQQYHVFVGQEETLVTADKEEALAKAANASDH